MTRHTENTMFLTGWLPGVFIKTAAPIVIITTVSGLFAVVDAYFLGVYVGADALSAVSLIFPALMLLVALQTLVSNGMASILARRLGAGDRDGAKSVFTGAHTLAIAVVVVVNVVYWLAARQFIAVAAAGNADVARSAEAFMGVMIAFAPISFFLSIHLDGLRCEGRLGFMTLVTLASTLLNILANWLLMAVAHWGVVGSAGGSILAQFICLMIVVIYRLRRPNGLWVDMGLHIREWRGIFAFGAPMSLGFIGISLSSAAILFNVSIWHQGDYVATVGAYGIVTRVGIWLNQRPSAIRPFFFTFPDDDDLQEIIELIRAMKKKTLVPTLIRATNDLYLLSSQERHPRSGAPTVAPLSLAERRDLQRRYGVGSWTVSGALYGGSDEALKPGIDMLRAHFEASGKARYIPFEDAQAMPHLHAAINTNSGRPADGELGMLKWRPGGGAIWLTPGAPMDGLMVNAFQAQCRKIALDNGLDYMASFVCGPRFARSVHAIIYDRDKAEEAARADRCYRAMCEAFRERGIFVGRAPTQYQAFHQGQRTPQVVNACAAIKQALDPNGIIAPGRYGIE